MGKIELIGDGQTAALRGERKTYGYLAIILFAELPTILTGNAYRVFAFLRKTRVLHSARRGHNLARISSLIRRAKGVFREAE